MSRVILRIMQFVQPLGLPKILAEFQINDDDYHRALSISNYDDFELHLKRNLNSCFVNNSLNEGLKAWQANIGI